MTVDAGSVTSTLTADSSGFVDAYEKAKIALQQSRAELAQAKAAMISTGGGSDELKAKIAELKNAVIAANAPLQAAKAQMMGAGTGAKALGDAAEHSEGGLHSLARGMRFSTSAALTMEGQMQHSGHAIVGILMGLGDPMMGAAMAFGFAVELVSKHFEHMTSTSEALKKVAADNIQSFADRGKSQLEALTKAANDAEKALRDLGLTAAQSKRLEADNTLGALVAERSELDNGASGLLATQQRIKQIDIEIGQNQVRTSARGLAAAHQANAAAVATLTAEKERLTVVVQAMQTSSATIDARLARAQSAADLTAKEAQDAAAIANHDKRAADVLEEIKKSHEAAKTASGETASFTLKIAEASERWASAAAEAAISMKVIGGMAPAPFAPPPDAVLANAGVNLQAYQPNTLPMPAGVGVQRPQLDAFSKGPEFADVIDATEEELRTLADTVGFVDDKMTIIDHSLGAWDEMSNALLATTRALEDFRAASQQVGQIGAAAVGGHGFSAAAGALGGVVGAGAGAALGDPTGLAGGAIGTALGDAVGGIVDDLAPFKDVGKEFTMTLGRLATAFLPLAPPAMELAKVFDELVTMSLPLATREMSALADVLTIAVEVAGAVATFGTMLYDINPALVLMEAVLDPLAKNAAGASKQLEAFDAGLVTLLKQFAYFIDSLKLPGVYLDAAGIGEDPDASAKRHQAHLDALRAAKQAAIDHAKATKENTKALQALTANLPTGWKGLNSDAFNAAPVDRNAARRRQLAAISDSRRRLTNMASAGAIADLMSGRGIGDDKG